jgi:hypothetical protein
VSYCQKRASIVNKLVLGGVALLIVGFGLGYWVASMSIRRYQVVQLRKDGVEIGIVADTSTGQVVRRFNSTGESTIP